MVRTKNSDIPSWFEYRSILKREIPHRKAVWRYLMHLKYFPRWKKHLTDPDPLKNRIPWINFPAIDFLARFCKPGMHVFEYGSGGSTFFWADRVAKVISVEHDPVWAQQVENLITKEQLDHVELIHQPPVPDADFSQKHIWRAADHISNNPHFNGYGFSDYVQVINRFPDASFDIAVIDGRARPSCIMAAKGKVRPHGILVVDNTEREYILQDCWPELKEEGWRRKDFFGPVPYLRHFCKTTILSKP